MGGDNHSRYSENDVKNFLKEADCQLYAIGIYDPIGIRFSNQRRAQWSFAAVGNDRDDRRTSFFPVGNIGELPDIAAQKSGMELRNQYVLGYKPSNAQRNGVWRKIKVKLKPAQRAPTPQTCLQRPATTRLLSSHGRLTTSIVAFFSRGFECVSRHRSSGAAIAGPHLAFWSSAGAAGSSSLRRKAPDQGQYRIQTQVNLVVLHTSVLNDRSIFVPGLKQENFRVFEDKVEQKTFRL